MLKWKITFLEKKYGSVNKEYLLMICNKMCAILYLSLYYDIDLSVNLYMLIKSRVITIVQAGGF